MSKSEENKTYLFEDFKLETSKLLLFRLSDGEKIPLTRKAFEVLQMLIENQGNLVSKEDLMAKVWAESFVEEANLTQTISVLRKKLGENPNQHRFIVTESGKGYRFVAEVKKMNKENENSAEIILESKAENKTFDRRKNRRIGYSYTIVVAVSLFIFVGIVYFWNKKEPVILQPSTAKEVRSIAVLPFKNIDSSETDKLLGLGMADAVINKLSHIKSIVVRQTNSVLHYADEKTEVAKVGKEINVDAVLDGNIQKADGRIRLSVRLFRVNDGALLWAESFDESEMDIFNLQDSISRKVAKSLSLELNYDEQQKLKRRYTENIEAYNLYNKGRFFWNNRNSEDLEKSIAFYQQAIELDENYALAYSGLAESYVLLHTFGQSQKNDAFPLAKEAAEKALSLDENLAEARTALALYKEQFEWDWEGAEKEFRSAIKSNPNYATAHQWFGEFLAFIGRTEEALAETEKAVELDPLSLSTNTARAFPYLAAKNYGQAIEKLKLAFELDKNFPLAIYYQARSLDGKGDYKNAIIEYRKAVELSDKSTYFISAMIYALVKSGQKAEAIKTFAEIEKIAKTKPVSNYVFARCLAALGENEKALTKLEDAFNERDSLMIVMKIDHSFDSLRNNLRFQTILRKMKL